MIDITKVCTEIETRAEKEGLSVLYTGASEKSDSVYLEIKKPKEIDPDYGVMEYWYVHVRVSNHFNHTNTIDMLTADHHVNIYRKDEIEYLVNEAFGFLANCETEITE